MELPVWYLLCEHTPLLCAAVRYGGMHSTAVQNYWCVCTHLVGWRIRAEWIYRAERTHTQVHFQVIPCMSPPKGDQARCTVCVVCSSHPTVLSACYYTRPEGALLYMHTQYVMIHTQVADPNSAPGFELPFSLDIHVRRYNYRFLFAGRYACFSFLGLDIDIHTYRLYFFQ